MARLKDTLRRFPGRCPAYLRLLRPGESETTVKLPEDLRVDPSDAFLREVEALLGPGSTVLRDHA